MMNSASHGDARQWLAVQVWTGREQLCATHLRSRGYDVLLPCYYEHRRWSDRVKKIERPLFAGYVFCCLDLSVRSKIVTTPGVVGIVGNRQGALPLPDSEIEAIRRLVETQVSAEPWPFLQPGQTVHVQAGPLQGIEGTVLVTKNNHRLVISVPLLQRSVAVEVDREWISVSPAASLAGDATSWPAQKSAS